MMFRPLHDRVLVKRINPLDKTKGGILLPDNAKEKPKEGIVISVGSGVFQDDGTILPLDVKEGDHILFSKWTGMEIKIDNVDHLVMKEGDILGVIEKVEKV